VTDTNGQPLNLLNELEIIKDNPKGLDKGLHASDYIFANRFAYPEIYMIDLRTGKVAAKWDLF
jgi:glutamine cyclotransferase